MAVLSAESQPKLSSVTVSKRPQVARIADAVVEDPTAGASATTSELNHPGDGTAGRRRVEALSQ